MADATGHGITEPDMVRIEADIAFRISEQRQETP
jgi:hypothetical protein